MKDTYSDNDPPPRLASEDAGAGRIENLLRKVRMPEPSPQLKARITTQARVAWSQRSGELPGRILFWRLAVSAAAAVLIIALANWCSDYAAGQWRSAKVVAVEQPGRVDALLDLPYGPFVGRLAWAARGSPHIDASSLSEHVQKVRQLLDEIRQNGTPAPVGSAGRRPPRESRLIPDKAGTNLYS